MSIPRLSRRLWSLMARALALIMAASITVLFATRRTSSGASTTASDGGIQFVQLNGADALNEFRKASATGGAAVSRLIDAIGLAISRLPQSNNSSATDAQREIAANAIMLSFGTAGWAAVTAPIATSLAAAAAPAILAIAAIAAVASAVIAVIEILKDRNVTIMIANMSELAFEVQDADFSPNSGYVSLSGAGGSVDAKPLVLSLQAGEQHKSASVGTFITSKQSAGFDIGGCIRLQSSELHNAYVAWQSPAVGKNAVAVGLLRSDQLPVDAMAFHDRAITPGRGRLQHTQTIHENGQAYTISAGLSDEDADFPSIVVTIEGPIPAPVPRVTFTFRNRSVFPAYFTRFRIHYIDGKGKRRRWSSGDVADGNSSSATLPGDVRILSVRCRYKDGFRWKRLRRINYNERAVDLSTPCFEATGPVGRPEFSEVTCT